MAPYFQSRVVVQSLAGSGLTNQIVILTGAGAACGRSAITGVKSCHLHLFTPNFQPISSRQRHCNLFLQNPGHSSFISDVSSSHVSGPIGSLELIPGSPCPKSGIVGDARC